MWWFSKRPPAPARPPLPPAPVTRSHLLVITARDEAIVLDPLRIGHLRFLVENCSAQTLSLRCATIAREPLDAAWLTPRTTAFDLDAGDRREIAVDITVPASAASGVRIAHLVVWSIANPDEDYLAGPEVTLTVPPYFRRRRLRIPGWAWTLLIILAALAGNAALVAALITDLQRIPPTTRVGVPALVGLSFDQAAADLEPHLVPGTLTTQRTATVARGTVVTQSLIAGAIVPPGTMVDVLIEDGWLMPDFRGGSATAAVERCAAESFQTTIVTRTDRSRPEPFGTVIGQTPLPGTIVDGQSDLRLTVLRGVTLPNLVGGDHGAAVQALTTLGLRLKPRMSSRPRAQGGSQLLSVIAQDPPAGTEVIPGTTVTLTLEGQAGP